MPNSKFWCAAQLSVPRAPVVCLAGFFKPVMSFMLSVGVANGVARRSGAHSERSKTFPYDRYAMLEAVYQEGIIRRESSLWDGAHSSCVCHAREDGKDEG